VNPPSRPVWLKHELYPFQDHWIDIDGNRVHFLDEGRGQAGTAVAGPCSPCPPCSLSQLDSGPGVVGEPALDQVAVAPGGWVVGG
jgi:hypothetical protein